MINTFPQPSHIHIYQVLRDDHMPIPSSPTRTGVGAFIVLGLCAVVTLLGLYGRMGISMPCPESAAFKAARSVVSKGNCTEGQKRTPPHARHSHNQNALMYWSGGHNGYLWHHEDASIIRIPATPPFTKYSLQLVLDKSAAPEENTNDNKSSVVLYGSSHMREIYFSLVRLERGIKFDAELEESVMQLRCGNKKEEQDPSCDPDGTEWLLGNYGVDMAACGPPGKRVVKELSNRSSVAIGFKTYLHTPDAEDLFVAF